MNENAIETSTTIVSTIS